MYILPCVMVARMVNGVMFKFGKTGFSTPKAV